MKDIILPIIMFITTLVASLLFVRGVYIPQKQTMNLISSHEYDSQIAFEKVVEDDYDEVSGNVVKTTIDFYDNNKKVSIKVYKGENVFVFNSINKDLNINIRDDEEYIKNIIRNKENKDIEIIKFILK